MGKPWVSAVETIIRDSGTIDLKPKLDSKAAADDRIFPVQVRGERWFYAQLENLLESEADPSGGTSVANIRRMGPLRRSSNAAVEDFKRMRDNGAKHDELEAKRHCSVDK